MFSELGPGGCALAQVQWVWKMCEKINTVTYQFTLTPGADATESDQPNGTDQTCHRHQEHTERQRAWGGKTETGEGWDTGVLEFKKNTSFFLPKVKCVVLCSCNCWTAMCEKHFNAEEVKTGARPWKCLSLGASFFSGLIRICKLRNFQALWRTLWGTVFLFIQFSWWM